MHFTLIYSYNGALRMASDQWHTDVSLSEDGIGDEWAAAL